ncbi:pentatricopeptide repeat-containing protein At1g12300, mitochondrial isoform X2 [Vigna radiata var. radiata]|uniref:Pentatricopeptide repeat-containing protein At1g12300, mitochondrial isoform X2 n=1 Tax=Vigna radiata var. radiata TaxID=3916 RepID=A0A3Q0FDR6_VIGRR|nr:pentatricopeptide repeat-containing protein At1g12300, mitochondrial isoform X2 [Vigna radiata var. radiata]
MWLSRSVRVSLLPSIAKFPPFLPIHNSLFCSHSHPQTSLHDEAVSQFNRLLHQRHVPPIFEFGKILGFLVRVKRYPTAISLIQQMELKGIHNNFVNLSLLINCFCHLNQLPFAFSVFVKILKRGYHPNAITLNTLMRGLCDNGEVKEALNFHDKVVALGFRLNQFTYGILINGLSKIGETEAAIELLRKIQGPSTRPNMFLISAIIIIMVSGMDKKYWFIPSYSDEDISQRYKLYKVTPKHTEQLKSIYKIFDDQDVGVWNT